MWITGSLIVLLCLNVVLWIWWLPRYMGKRLEQFQNDLVNQHYAEVENMYRQMRGWRHDYHNHIQAMEAYIELGKYQEMQGYLHELDASLYRVDQIIKTGNLMVDAILNSKLTLMKDKKINTDVTASVPPQMKAADMELCVLLGNLLDNAIEAAEKVEAEEDRFVRIYMDTLQNQFYLSVMNSMKGKAERQGSHFISRKAGGARYGFGLRQTDRIVEKYGGYLNRQTEDGVFATEVMLPL